MTFFKMTTIYHTCRSAKDDYNLHVADMGDGRLLLGINGQGGGEAVLLEADELEAFAAAIAALTTSSTEPKETTDGHDH